MGIDQEEGNKTDHENGSAVTPDPRCRDCGGTGVVTHCGWCSLGLLHSNCDDTVETCCGCDAESPKDWDSI